MSEMIIERVKESVGKEVKIFTDNNFRFAGKLLKADDTFVEILDYHINGYKIIRISTIIDIEVKK